VEILEAVHYVIHWCDIDAVDAVMSSDVAIRLGLLYESAAILRSSHQLAGTGLLWTCEVIGVLLKQVPSHCTS